MLAALASGCGSSGSSGTIVPGTDLLYPIYPDTDSAPVLTFYWGSPRATSVPPTVSGIGRYGEWDGGGNYFKTGYEPATEIEIRSTSFAEPVYTNCSGTVVKKGDVSTNVYGQEVSYLSIRYGRKYVVKHLHLADIPSSITVGSTVDKGTLIGYTERMGTAFGFWEIEMNVIRSDEVVAVPPDSYFDSASRTVLAAILRGEGESSWALELTSPTSEGWVSYVGTREMWGDAAKCGIRRPENYRGLDTFLSAYGLDWVIAP